MNQSSDPRPLSMKDHEVIEAFVSYLCHNGHPNLSVSDWPDRQNRKSPDIDAIAGSFAIEHTSVDVLEDKRLRDSWFGKVIGNLEKELKDRVDFRLRIQMSYRAVSKGQDWKAMQKSLEAWIIHEASTLAAGGHSISIAGFPFPVSVEKATDEPPGVFFWRRIEENDDTLEVTIKSLIERKISKLVPYKAAGKITILLLESNDIALINRVILSDAISNAFPEGLPAGVDQVWFADTAILPHVQFDDITPS